MQKYGLEKNGRIGETVSVFQMQLTLFVRIILADDHGLQNLEPTGTGGLILE